MTIELSPAQEQVIAAAAERNGVTPEAFVRGLVSNYEQYISDYVRDVQRGLDDAAAGRVTEHEEFFDRWEREIAARHATEQRP